MTSDIPGNSVTLATIAAYLGVSRSTVSNAYNHPDQLSPTLRQKILDTASSLGYTGPDPVARRLRKGRAGAIGVLFSEALQHAFSDAASMLFLEGVASASEDADSGMLLIPARPSEQNAGVVHDAMVDGFILYSIPPGHPFVDVALNRRVPVVCVDQTRIPGVSWVGIDDQRAAENAANHLLDLGHRRIAVLVYGLAEGEDPGDSVGSSSGNKSGDRNRDNTDVITHSKFSTSGNGEEEDGAVLHAPSVSRLRLAGYRAACDRAGVSWDDVTIVACNSNTETDGARAAHALFANSERPTAVLCTSDALALGLLDVARTLGISVPDELSVVGFNDLPVASYSHPPLTTVRQPLKEKGARAASLLLEHKAGESQAEHLAAELIVRSSTAIAPK